MDENPSYEVRIVETNTGQGKLFHIEAARLDVIRRVGVIVDRTSYCGWLVCGGTCYIRKQDAVYQAKLLHERLNAEPVYHEVSSDD